MAINIQRLDIPKVTIRLITRSLQLLFAIVIAALYGSDLQYATETKAHANSNWIYAEFVAFLSIVTCTAHCLTKATQLIWSIWDWVLFILWVAQFGIFGKLYLGNDNTSQDYGFTQSVSRMNAAAWMSLANMLLWLAIGVHDIVRCCAMRKTTKSTYTAVDLEGAADVPHEVDQPTLSDFDSVISEVREKSLEIKVVDKKAEAALAAPGFSVAPPPYTG